MLGIRPNCRVQQAGLEGLFSCLLIADKFARYNGQDHLGLSSKYDTARFHFRTNDKDSIEVARDGLRGLMNVCVEVSVIRFEEKK